MRYLSLVIYGRKIQYHYSQYLFKRELLFLAILNPVKYLFLVVILEELKDTQKIIGFAQFGVPSTMKQ